MERALKLAVRMAQPGVPLRFWDCFYLYLYFISICTYLYLYFDAFSFIAKNVTGSKNMLVFALGQLNDYDLDHLDLLDHLDHLDRPGWRERRGCEEHLGGLRPRLSPGGIDVIASCSPLKNPKTKTTHNLQIEKLKLFNFHKLTK